MAEGVLDNFISREGQCEMEEGLCGNLESHKGTGEEVDMAERLIHENDSQEGLERISVVAEGAKGDLFNKIGLGFD